MTRRRQILLDCVFIFLGAAVLVKPYFLSKYSDQWPSIESTFIADARFLAAHFPHPRWQPLWYTGTRFDYVYPPALRYGTAIVSMVTGWWPVKAYHFYTIFFYCCGAAAVYLLVRVAGRGRGFAWWSAAGFALMSPSFLFMKDMRADSGHLTPARLGVLLRYGEGPHMTALALLPLALALAWIALERSRPRWVALAAISCALVVSNNFYGATALAITYPLLVWSIAITKGGRAMILPSIAIPALAYGLTAFWLTPSYLSITSYNLQFLPHPTPTLWSYWSAIVLLTAYLTVSNRFARSRPELTWAVFVSGLVVAFSLDVLGNYYFGFGVGGDPHRLVPELDLALILGTTLVLEWMWNRRASAARIGGRIAACVLILAALYTTKGYVRRAWHVVAPWPDYTSRVEFKVSDWVWKNMPGARVCTSGSVRFWFDAWHDLNELGGGSEQGLLNPVVQQSQWEIANGTDPVPLRLWLQVLAVDAIYYAGPKSEEPYKDYRNPERFASLPLLWDDGQDDRIYAVPRRYRTRARVVDAARLYAAKAPANIEDLDRLQAYADIVENGPDSPATIERPNTDAILVHAKLQAGQDVLLQETWDSSWRASDGGKSLTIHKDPLGFMVVEAPPGDHNILLEYAMPSENRFGWGLTAASVLALAGLIFRRER